MKCGFAVSVMQVDKSREQILFGSFRSIDFDEVFSDAIIGPLFLPANFLPGLAESPHISEGSNLTALISSWASFA